MHFISGGFNEGINLQQVHIFGEGNTRTTAVFFIKYLRTLGFSATNDIFAENAWYFRNALVRANYTNLQKGIHETTEYLETFLRNLLLNEKNELNNRNLHIIGLLNEEKVDIENEKVDIQDRKVDIESILSEKGSDFSVKTTIHIHRLFEKFGVDEVFGRSAVMESLELKGLGASKFLSNLVQADTPPMTLIKVELMFYLYSFSESGYNILLTVVRLTDIL